MRTRITAGLSVLAATAATLVALAPSAAAATPLPKHVFAPYFEA